MLIGSPVALWLAVPKLPGKVTHRSGKGCRPIAVGKRLDIDRGAVRFDVNDLLLESFCRIDEPGCVSHSEWAETKKLCVADCKSSLPGLTRSQSRFIDHHVIQPFDSSCFRSVPVFPGHETLPIDERVLALWIGLILHSLTEIKTQFDRDFFPYVGRFLWDNEFGKIRLIEFVDWSALLLFS